MYQLVTQFDDEKTVGRMSLATPTCCCCCCCIVTIAAASFVTARNLGEVTEKRIKSGLSKNIRGEISVKQAYLLGALILPLSIILLALGGAGLIIYIVGWIFFVKTYGFPAKKAVLIIVVTLLAIVVEAVLWIGGFGMFSSF